MKNFKKILKWSLLGLTILVLTVAIFIGIIGVPKPPAITTENVPRVPLGYVKTIYASIDDFDDYSQFRVWSRDSDGMYVMKINNLQLKLHMLEAPGEEPKLVEGVDDNAYLTINPNPEKKNAVYLKDIDGDENYQIYLFDFNSGTSKMISNGKNPHRSLRFNPQGDSILYLSNRRNNIDSDLYIMNPEDPSSERLIIENEKGVFIDSFSPEGDKVIIRKYISATENDPYILDISTGELSPLKQDPTIKEDYNWHLWSNDGSKIYYPSSYQSEFKRLHVRDLDTGHDSVLTKDINWDVGNVFQSPDSKWLIFNVNEDGVISLYIHKLATGETKKFDKLGLGSIPFAFFHLYKNSLIGFNFTYPTGESDIYSYNLETEELVQWTDNRKENSIPDPEIIHYPTFDIDTIRGEQRKITAYYYKPQETYDKPYPVIIDIHGGPFSQATLSDPIPFELDLSRGIAVLVPNVRGSSGYGKTFTDLDNGRLREDAVKDIGALLDWIEQHPELDANRIIVRGGSYGGYMALASAMHYSDRLLGAVDYVGISNFVTFLEYQERNADRTSEFGDVNDPEMRAFLENISPLNNVDKIDIPIFIGQGKNDPRVPVFESRQMVEQLTKEGKDVWYIEASDEGHGFQKPWNAFYSKVAEFKFVDDLIAQNK